MSRIYGRIPRAIALGALLLAGLGVSAQGIGKVVGLEAGYGYALSSPGLESGAANAAVLGLRYGYLILDRPSMSALLSLALGYTVFPGGAGGALNSIVYGLEYEHSFFRDSPLGLSIEYGLLFDLVLEGGRSGYAFGNHTRLGLGPRLRLGEKDGLELLVDYNGLALPYFELSSGRKDYLSAALRYERRL